MISQVLDLLLVLVSLSALYGLPPALFIRALLPGIDRAERILITFGAGLASQAGIALLWNHLLGQRQARLEPLAYLACWILLTIVIRFKQRHRPPPPPSDAPFPLRQSLPLFILIGLALRSLDGLHHAALGQSDAYSHLQFLRHILAYGHILNIIYPPGYSWVLALPTLLFNLDPYMVARYAGPFFGGLLILAIHRLGRHHSREAARYGAFLTACFPGFYLLIKTGMGAFANQLGLVFLPLALHLHLRRQQEPGNAALSWLFGLVVLGLGASVPMLMFNLFLVVAAHRLTRPGPDGFSWWRRTAGDLAWFAPAILLATFHFLRPGDLHINATATMVTGIPIPVAQPALATAPAQAAGFIQQLCTHPMGRLLVDFLTPKRAGLGGGLMAVAALGLAGLFATFLARGCRTRSSSLKLLGAWGLLATLQTTTGLLDFSLYQRSGWSLLEAVAWAGGIVCALITIRLEWSRTFRVAVALAMVVTAVAAFYAPPSHRFITSGAEDELVTVLRSLSDARLTAAGLRGPLRFEHPDPGPLVTAAARQEALSVMTRRYTLFPGDQGDLLNAVADPAARLKQSLVDSTTVMPRPCGPILALIDTERPLEDTGVWGRISPALANEQASYQPLLYAPNRMIAEYLASLPSGWSLRREDHGPRLMLFLAAPPQP